MAQVSYGTITISDITDINDLRTEYCILSNQDILVEDGSLAYILTTDTAIDNTKTYYKQVINEEEVSFVVVSNPSTSQLSTYFELQEVIWSEQIPLWQENHTIWVRKAKDIEGVGIEYTTPYEYTIIEQLIERDNNNQLLVRDLSHKLSSFWTNSIGHFNGQDDWTKPDYPAGSYVAATGLTDLDIEDSDTYGYNTYLGGDVLSLRHDATNLVNLRTNQLTFFFPMGLNTQGDRGLQIGSEGINIYNPNKYVNTTDTSIELDKIYYKLLDNVYTPYLPTTEELVNSYELDKAVSINSSGINIYNGSVGGIAITNNSIYGGNKVLNGGEGFYIDNNGNFSVGNETGYITYTNGELSICTDNIFASNNTPLITQIEKNGNLFEQLGIYNWIAEHGEFGAADSTGALDASKMYFTRFGTAEPYVYSYVKNPNINDLRDGLYYEYTNGPELIEQLNQRFGGLDALIESNTNNINTVNTQRQADYNTWDNLINGEEGILQAIEDLRQKTSTPVTDKYAPFFKFIQANNELIATDDVGDASGLRLGIFNKEDQDINKADYIELKVIQSETNNTDSELKFTFHQNDKDLLCFVNKRGVVPELVSKTIYFSTEETEYLAGENTATGIGWIARANGHVSLKRLT